MSPWFHAHVEDGHYVACETTDGRLVHMQVGRTFTGPRQVVDFTEMRNRHISPLRSPAEPSDPSFPTAQQASREAACQVRGT